MGHSYAFAGHPEQRGAVLIVSLLILLVMTILGIAALKGTVLEERMAGNLRDQHLAFQAAEAALRGGEPQAAATATAVALPNPALWDGTTPSGTAVTVTGGLASDPLFHVGPPQYARIGNALPAEFRCIYRVTSRGVGGSDAAVVVLQTNYEPIGSSCD